MKRTIALVAAAMVAAVLCSACNTVEGIGKDVEKGGEVIQKTAK